MKIKMLNESTISKIAAGEAIIRPVSVIKELVENAIDAGASRIRIEIENGGKTRMVVSDNGCGIAYNEVPLAFERHATSKLLHIEDLQTIQTLGFRGEALASIMAVSKVRITTRAADEEIGSCCIFESGMLAHQRVCGHDRGTVIEVSDLFYNMPVRQKHMGKAGNEALLIRDLVEKMALSHPEIAVAFFSDRKKLFSTTGSGKLQNAIEGIYGRGFFQNLMPLDNENAPMRLHGYIGKLNASRSSKDFQVFFVNGRYVRNPALSRAFEEAYEGYLMQHRHPVGIVFIDLPGKMLDVNIHPAKTEIAILNQSLVMILFKQGIRQTLRAADLTVEIRSDSDQNEEAVSESKPKADPGLQMKMTAFVPPTVSDSTQIIEEKGKGDISKLSEHSVAEKAILPSTAANVQMSGKDEEKSRDVMLADVTQRLFEPKDPAVLNDQLLSHTETAADVSETLNRPEVRVGRVPVQPTPGMEKISPENQSGEIVADHQAVYNSQQRSMHRSSTKQDATAIPKVDFSQTKIIGQLFSTYIVLEREKEAWIIDQHAAHEAFMYEELRRRFERKENFPAQHLLVPVPISVETRIVQNFGDWSEELLSYGFECDIFGEDTLMVRSVPVILGEPQEAELICAFLDSRFYQTEPDRDFQIRKIITMACKAAVKGNQALSHGEIRKLLEQLSTLENPFTCPHGRPIIFKLREYDLRKMFKRIV